MRRLPFRSIRPLRLVLAGSLTAIAAFSVTAIVATPGAGAIDGATVDSRGDAPAVAPLDADLARLAVAATPVASGGFWLVTSDGRVVSAGGAPVIAASIAPAAAVDIVATPTGRGYWLAASDGGVFAFGDATFFGSAAGVSIDPIVAMATSPAGNGYWLLASDGGVFSFGDAAFVGSGAGSFADERAATIVPTPGGDGYWVVGQRGTVLAFGAASELDPATLRPDASLLDAFASPSGRGLTVIDRRGIGISLGDAAPFPSGDPSSVYRTVAPTASGRGAWLVRESRESAPAFSGSGRRIVYSNSRQRVWLIEGDGSLFDTYLVSGRVGVPAPGRYHIFSKSPVSFSGSLRLFNMARFAHGRTLSIGFHSIPVRPNGTPIQTLAELGQFRSHGCVRQDPVKAAQLYAWAPIGTPVIVVA